VGPDPSSPDLAGGHGPARTEAAAPEAQQSGEAWIVRRFQQAEARLFGRRTGAHRTPPRAHQSAAPAGSAWISRPGPAAEAESRIVRAFRLAMQAPAAAGPLRALLAESDAISARVLRHRLERDGLAVSECADGDAALEALRGGGFAVALLDVRLGGLNGFELLRAVRDGEAGAPDLPVVLFCWPGNDAVVVRAFAMQASDVIHRPFSLAEASARIRRLVAPARR
jgi:CheY-like chemotaxis protein